jgi:hypothetical protein
MTKSMRMRLARHVARMGDEDRFMKGNLGEI